MLSLFHRTVIGTILSQWTGICVFLLVAPHLRRPRGAGGACRGDRNGGIIALGL
jgi:hypothetical protein